MRPVREERRIDLDEGDIRQFLETNYPRLVAGLALACGSRAAAEDAVQEALARAWERSERGQTIESLAAWVTTVSLNLTRSWLRRARAERRAREHFVVEEDPGPSVEAIEDLRRAIASLPRRQREALVVHYYLGLAVKETAHVLGVTDGTVTTSLHRARTALAPLVAETEAEQHEVANDVQS